MPEASPAGQRHGSLLRGKDKKTIEEETKKVIELLIEQYGYAPDLIFEIRGNRKVYAYKDCPLDMQIHAERGIYFGKIESDGIRLTIEGAFLVGPKAERNVIELDREKMLKWMKGEDVPVDFEGNAWVILKHNMYYLGGGKASGGVVRNYVPKDRRIR
ncbi:methyltransferase RsmF C-terminal domain-like protein [Palaeococcus sp. (in: euryarchaeotes)]